jgi:hypothetical protein
MKNSFKQVFFILFVGLGLAAHAQQDAGDVVMSTLDLQTAQLPAATIEDDLKPGVSRFLLRGYAHTGLEATSEDVSFVGGSFSPIFIYRQSDRLLFESELDFELEGSEVNVGLEYANISYLLTKSLTLRAGKFLTPFGIYISNLHPAWINKFPSNPLGVGHGGILPIADLGAELRGAYYLGSMKTNFSLYVVNGPQLNDGSLEAEEGGVLHFGVVSDNNKGKAAGGRIGFFPFSNSSLEIGFSGQFGKVGANESRLEDVSARLYGMDLSYVRSLPGISSVIDIKAQWAMSDVDEAEYPEEDDPAAFHTFDNNSTTWFAQLSLRPSFVENNFFRNLEFAGRYSTLTTPEGAPWEADQEQWEVSINYWLDWRTAFKFSYRNIGGTTGEEGHGGGEEGPAADTFFIHWAIGF